MKAVEQLTGVVNKLYYTSGKTRSTNKLIASTFNNQIWQSWQSNRFLLIPRVIRSILVPENIQWISIHFFKDLIIFVVIFISLSVVLEINPKVKNIGIIRMNWNKHLFFTFSFFDIFWYMFEEVRRQGNKCIFSQLIISNGINVTYCYTPWVNVLITQRVKMCWRVRGIRPCARWTNLFLLFWSEKNKL